MAKQVINIGTIANDGTGDTLRDAMDKTNDNFNELYGATGWMARFDAATVALTGGVETTMVITTTAESNGGLTLMDANSKVTPIAQGDYVVIDFSTTVVTPSGPDHHFHIDIQVNGVTYRSASANLMKGPGVDHAFSVSWGFPVGADFYTYGAVVKVMCDVNVNIKDRYIAVARGHKAL